MTHRSRSETKALISLSALSFAASLSLNIAGFVFHAIASRSLGVAAYGALYTAIALYGLAYLPAQIFSPVIAKLAAELYALEDTSHLLGLLRRIVRTFALVGGVYVAAGCVFVDAIARYTHLAPAIVVLISVMAALGLLLSVVRAFSQGAHNFQVFTFSSVAEGVAKVCALVFFAFFGVTIFNGTMSFAFGLLAGLVTMLLPLLWSYRHEIPRQVKLDWHRILRTTFGAASVAFATVCLGFADTIIVKHVFSANEAGLYSAVSLSGKIVFYFVGFIPAVLLPYTTRRHAQGERARTTLLLSLAFIAVSGLLVSGGSHFFGNLFMRVLVGAGFDRGVSLVPGYCLAMTMLAMTNTTGAYAIATHRFQFALPLILSTVITIALIQAYHPSLATVVVDLVAGNALILSSVGIAVYLQGRQLAMQRVVKTA